MLEQGHQVSNVYAAKIHRAGQSHKREQGWGKTGVLRIQTRDSSGNGKVWRAHCRNVLELAN